MKHELFTMKHSLSCGCGEFYLILADRYDHNFEIEKAITFVQRVLHRLYECPLTAFHLKEVV